MAKFLTLVILACMAAFVPSAGAQQAPQRGRGERGQAQQPPIYYGGGVYGPGRRPSTFDQRWNGVPGGRFYQGRYYAPGVGPCWTWLPVINWTWTCGP